MTMTLMSADTSKLIREFYLENGDVAVLEDFKKMMFAPYGPGVRSGVLFRCLANC